MVDVKVLKKKDNGLEVSILEDEGNVIAWIPTVHLSDFVVNCKLLWHCLQEGDVLPRVMCLSDKGERIRFTENSQHSAIVQLVAEEFAIVSLLETGQLAAVPIASHFNDTFRFDSEKLKYNVLKNWLEVEVTPDIRGRIPHLLLSLNTKVLKHPEKSFKNGQAISATVTGTDVTETNLCLSLTGIQSLEQGTVAVGMVTKVTPHMGLTIALPGGKTGRVNIFHLNDTYTENPLGDFKVGKIVRLVGNAGERKRPSGSAVTIFLAKQSFVLAIDMGLSTSLLGRILFQNVSTYFVQNHSLYEKYLPEGKLLTAKVLGVTGKHIELSLLPEDTGMPSVLPESLGLPRYDAEEEKREADDREKSEELKMKTKRRRGNSESEQEVKPKKPKVCPADENDSGIELKRNLR
ncbi:hypothetical protein llap_15506 [Limosa lapponica baueri]|uniref:S1 motif domain-containing protein n=1 Tax=Limosa lapponica baueri TaxID=1758121 RepID=A0A2I0TKD1_LIMLA|nr:hypothetical protein llap_15506 [Limosa lapponica baueri]